MLHLEFREGSYGRVITGTTGRSFGEVELEVSIWCVGAIVFHLMSLVLLWCRLNELLIIYLGSIASSTLPPSHHPSSRG